MPKGKHKGNHRHFTNFEALEAAKKKEEKEREWRSKKGEESSEGEDDEEKKKSEDDDESSSEEASTEEEDGEVKEIKPKGPAALIEIENPNRLPERHQKVSALNVEVDGGAAGHGGGATGGGRGGAGGKPQLSRREREEVEKQKATAKYRQMHAAGKTDEARADLARLALIRQEREEAGKKREEERLARETAAKAKATKKT